MFRVRQDSLTTRWISNKQLKGPVCNCFQETWYLRNLGHCEVDFLFLSNQWMIELLTGRHPWGPCSCCTYKVAIVKKTRCWSWFHSSGAWLLRFEGWTLFAKLQQERDFYLVIMHQKKQPVSYFKQEASQGQKAWHKYCSIFSDFQWFHLTVNIFGDICPKVGFFFIFKKKKKRKKMKKNGSVSKNTIFVEQRP